MKQQHIRNLCIIAHVDHGKTTLVDHLLKQSGLFASHEKTSDRMMDSGDLEREKGITILAKNASIQVKNIKINIVDTPGHADFGGEVERILGTVDGAVLLVDAAEGPLPQTRFVLEKALAQGHRVILCINKVDRPEVQGDNFKRINEVIDATFELFIELGGTQDQCDFPIIYACAREGWCTKKQDEIVDLISGAKKGSLEPLFDEMINFIPAPEGDVAASFKMQLSSLAWSDYVGQLAIGRVVAGEIRKNQTIYRLGFDADKSVPVVQKFQISNIYAYTGMRQIEVESLKAGEIGVIAGCNEIYIGDTLAANPQDTPFERITVEAPTLKMIFTINSTPMSGRDGEAIQSRKLKERLERECRSNVALGFELGETSDQFYLKGRGELQFAILIETMRRENLEFMVGRPVVVMKEEAGQKLEPVESAICDLPEEFSGGVTDMFQMRKGILTSYENLSPGRVRLIFDIPSRGLLGMRSRFLTITKGQGLLNSKMKGYESYRGDMLNRKNGTLISDRAGKTTDYALQTLEERGTMFIGQGVEVYEGMIIGECNVENDMNVNPVRPKKLTNIRTTSSDGIVMLAGVRKMSLEEFIEWIDDDEWIEVTPKTIRVRKKELTQNKRTVIRSLRK